MIELTHNNLVYFGYEDGMFNEKIKPKTFSWTFTPVSRTPGNLQEECVNAANLISQKAESLGRIPVVLLSGGADSEVVCKSFIDAGVKFEAVSFSYPDDTLNFETKYIDEFVKLNNLKHRYVVQDWHKWMRTDEARQMYIDSCATFVTEIQHLKLFETVCNEMNGFPIIGDGDPIVEKINNVWHYINREDDSISSTTYCWRKSIQAAPLFFQHTPELILSFLTESRFKDLFTGKDKLGNTVLRDARILKIKTFQKYWPDIIFRPKRVQYINNVHLYERIRLDWNIENIEHRDFWSMPCLDLIEHLKSNL